MHFCRIAIGQCVSSFYHDGQFATFAYRVYNLLAVLWSVLWSVAATVNCLATLVSALTNNIVELYGC